MSKSVKIFIAYSREDGLFLERLRSHLSILERREDILVDIWYDGKIEIASIWENQIKDALHTADFILLLISSDFIASNYAYDVEMKEALKLHEQGKTIVVPIILRRCLWKYAPFARIQVLPKDGKPIDSKTWDTIDTPYFQIVDFLANKIDSLSYDKALGAARYHYQQKQWLQALKKYEEAKALINLEDFETLKEIEEAIQHCEIEQKNANYFNQGQEAYQNGDYQAAVRHFRVALKIKPDKATQNFIKKCLEAISFATREKERNAYNSKLIQADELFEVSKWRNALDVYHEAKALFQPGFDPPLSYINDRIDQCRKEINFLETIDQAQTAFANRRWQQALAFWEKVITIKKEESVLVAYEACQQKIREILGMQLVRFKDEHTKKYGFKNKGDHEVIIPPKYDKVFRFTEIATPVKFNNKWGLIDKTDKVLVPFEYDYAESFSSGKAYFQKMGGDGIYLDTHGNVAPN